MVEDGIQDRGVCNSAVLVGRWDLSHNLGGAASIEVIQDFE
jgi:hypothetical protein